MTETNESFFIILTVKYLPCLALSCLTRVMSLEAAAALMWRLGCLTVLVQSKALAKVPTDLKYTHQYLYQTLISCGVNNKIYNTQNGYLISLSNTSYLDMIKNWSTCLSASPFSGFQIKSSNSSITLLSASSPSMKWQMSFHFVYQCLQIQYVKFYILHCEATFQGLFWDFCLIPRPNTNFTLISKQSFLLGVINQGVEKGVLKIKYKSLHHFFCNSISIRSKLNHKHALKKPIAPSQFHKICQIKKYCIPVSKKFREI